MANIRFNLERTKSYTYIFLIYDVAPGDRLKMSLKTKVDPSQWSIKHQNTLPSHDNHHEINQLLDTIRRNIERTRIQMMLSHQAITVGAIRDVVASVINPIDTNVKVPLRSNLDQRTYFEKVYELLPDRLNLKDVYFEVESIWNSHGVQMFPSYDAFRTGKHRYMKNKPKSITKAPKAITNY